MIQVCVDCGVIYGEKEPLEDKSYTHGYCPKCYTKAITLLEEQIRVKKTKPNPPILVKIKHCKHADSDHKKRERWYAHTGHRPSTICVSRAFYSLPDYHKYAIFAHEIGHLLGGKTQRAADQLGNRRFGIEIKYVDSSFGKSLQYLSPSEIKRVARVIQ